MAAKAAGKVNAAGLQVNDRIIVTISESGYIQPSQTKTGADVHIVRVTGKSARMVFTGRRQNRIYMVQTSAGEIGYGLAPIQTMWLAPEDAAGIKRAHVEAIAEQGERWKAGMDEILDEALDEELAREEAANAISDAQTAQVEGWLARHREAGTPRTQWSPIEDARRADHAEALLEDEERYYTVLRAELAERALDEATDAQAEAYWAEAEAAQAENLKGLTLHSQDGKVSDMDNDAATQTPTVTGDMSGSAVVELMEMVWGRIRENHPELPAVVIVTGSGLIGGSKWGHFRRDGWKVKVEGSATSGNLDEMFMAGETLAKGARQVLQTMLHEGAHTLAKVRGVQDTSRQNRWHNAKFKELAEEMGLEHKAAQADKSIGFSFVTLTEATIERYADLLTELDAAIRLVCHLPAWLGGSDEDEKGGEHISKKPRTTEPSKTTNVKLTCACDEPVIIRASRKVADLMQVRCDECEALFKEDRG